MEHFHSQHGVDICLYMRHSLILGKPSVLPTMSATSQTDRQLGAAQPTWYVVVYSTTQCPFRV